MFEVKNIEDVNLSENPVIAQMSKYNHEEISFGKPQKLEPFTLDSQLPLVFFSFSRVR